MTGTVVDFVLPWTRPAPTKEPESTLCNCLQAFPSIALYGAYEPRTLKEARSVFSKADCKMALKIPSLCVCYDISWPALTLSYLQRDGMCFHVLTCAFDAEKIVTPLQLSKLSLTIL